MAEVAKKKVVRRKTAAGIAARPAETAPGDILSLALTMEVTDAHGRRVWAKVGLDSAHRPEESSAEAQARVEDFVIGSLDAFMERAVE